MTTYYSNDPRFDDSCAVCMQGLVDRCTAKFCARECSPAADAGSD